MLYIVFVLQTPLSWQGKWDGPEDPMQYLRGLVTRAQAIQTWVEKAESGRLLQETLDLSELFHPDTFLNALRQQTARFGVYILKVSINKGSGFLLVNIQSTLGPIYNE